MKKFSIALLVVLCLSFNMTMVTSIAETKSFKEGFYKVTDLNFSPDNIYTIQNVSATDRVYVLIFDENQTVIQSVRLRPLSSKYNLLPLEYEYRIVIVGDGDVIIS